MEDGRMTIVFLLFLFAPSCEATGKENKFYTTYAIPIMKWFHAESLLDTTTGAVPDAAKAAADESRQYIPYKHEILTAGGLQLKINDGSNYSVYGLDECAQSRISFIVQLDPKNFKDLDTHKRQQKTCTISITVDDGHVEVWYGLCQSKKETHKRKFDFPISALSIVYFNFDRLTMRMYKKDHDDAPAFEMGRVEHYTEDKDYEYFEDIVFFLYYDACSKVALKEVFSEDVVRNRVVQEKEEKHVGDPILYRMLTIFFVIQSFTCLILSTMYVWSVGVPFFTNRLYDLVFLRYTKEGVVAKNEAEEPKSCKSAEEPSMEWEATSGKKEDLFGEKGKHKAPMRAPAGYALADYDAPYEDDPEPVSAEMVTAVAKDNDAEWDGKVAAEATPPPKTPQIPDAAGPAPSEKSSKAPEAQIPDMGVAV